MTVRISEVEILEIFKTSIGKFKELDSWPLCHMSVQTSNGSRRTGVFYLMPCDHGLYCVV